MLKILDTTLREGEQTPGVYFDTHIKIAIADLLNEIGIDIIEAGHPVVSQDINDAITKLCNKNYNSLIGAHSRSIITDIDMALNCGVGFIGIFYCVSNQRLNEVFNTNIDNAISKITNTIKYAKQKNPKLKIRFTPEDTVRSNFDNVVKASVAAVNAGADIISIADTTGHMIPGSKNNMFDYVKKLKNEFQKNNVSPEIAVHCHNDRGFALSNALDAYRAGANIIDASVLGIGERAGIVDLANLLVVLKNDFEIGNWNLTKLKKLYGLVSKYANIPIPVNFPIMGQNAFTHCAGVHTQAALINPAHYQSLDPNLIGEQSKISLDHMSGLSSIKYMIKKNGYEINDELSKKILQNVKKMGHKGKIVDEEEFIHIVEMVKNGNIN
jgi:2-isopropylmalate synthase